MNREHLAAVQHEITAVSTSADPAHEATVLEQQIRTLEEDRAAASRRAEVSQDELSRAREEQRRRAEAAAAAGQGLREAESRRAALLGEIQRRDAELRRVLGARGPTGDLVIEAWVQGRASALAWSRKAFEDATARVAQAERCLAEAQAEERGARQRLEDKQAERRRVEEEQQAAAPALIGVAPATGGRAASPASVQPPRRRSAE